jgi:hydroxyethylthiazole kinase-like sugar kinase family protein
MRPPGRPKGEYRSAQREGTPVSLPLEPARLPADSPFGATAVAADLRAVRERVPLVHNVTNLVVMQQTANALLALRAAVDAMAVMGVAGELALAAARGPGTMAASFFDALHHLDFAELEPRLRVDEPA